MKDKYIKLTDLNGSRVEKIQSYSTEGGVLRATLEDGTVIERAGRFLVPAEYYIVGVWGFFWGFAYIVEA